MVMVVLSPREPAELSSRSPRHHLNRFSLVASFEPAFTPVEMSPEHEAGLQGG